MSPTIESLISQIEVLASSADLSVRYKLAGQLSRLASSIATPRQIMQQHGYMYAEQAMFKIASDLDIFTILAQSEHPMRAEDIASKCSCDPALADRILRHLAAIFTVSEVEEATFTANETTRLLASPAGKGNVQFGFDTLNRAFQELPGYLKGKSYKNPDQLLDTAFHRAYDTKLPYFLWVQSHPDIIKYFFPSLSAFASPITWAQVVPLGEKLKDTDKDANTPLFVDLGGGQGAQCAAFYKAVKGRFSGRIINQDLPETLADAPREEGVEMMVQDFYEEQQVKGARIYYIRQCLHDLPDEGAKQVLQRIRDAMSPQSLLFIDELVIPATGASRFAMQLDVTMMSMFSSTERTLHSWRTLLSQVGLEITQVYKYDPELEYSILEAIPIKS